jgi:acetyl-CoA carboxylase carboxyltransferase component
MSREQIAQASTEAQAGGKPKYHDSNAAKGKLFARERIALLCDDNSFVEDGMLANNQNSGLPADGVITGIGCISGRAVAIMANDSTVKAGSWGARTVEKIIRIQEKAGQLRIPLVYLVDSAGARITDQLHMFPGDRGAGTIFDMQIKLSGSIPQVCLLFGPSAAGGAYIPAFCDVVFMVNKNASMYLGSPRMAELVINERVTLEEMGGARMHCSQSGNGDMLCKTEQEALEACQDYLSYLPSSSDDVPPLAPSVAAPEGVDLAALIPDGETLPMNIKKVIDALVDEGSFFEIKKLFAKEIVTGFARLDGCAIGVIANNAKHLGGVLFKDSADKAAKFISICDAYGLPLLFLADVPGFMIGSKVEREGIIRHGAKMLHAMASASVPKISVVVRKAYGAGLYAMCGKGFKPDAALALPRARIAVMGAEPAVNAVFYNKIMQLEGDEREAFVAEKRAEYSADIDILRLASDLHLDAIIEESELRNELILRFAYAENKVVSEYPRRRYVVPV